MAAFAFAGEALLVQVDYSILVRVPAAKQ